jgi:glucose/mannose transport system substrate-binding protein
MFGVEGDKVAAQVKMASRSWTPTSSRRSTWSKARPARTDVPDDAFDDCGKKGIKDLAEANTKNTLLGSIAHGHAVPASIKNAIYDVITRHFNGQIDDKKAVVELAAAGKK